MALHINRKECEAKIEEVCVEIVRFGLRAKGDSETQLDEIDKR